MNSFGLNGAALNGSAYNGTPTAFTAVVSMASAHAHRVRRGMAWGVAMSAAAMPQASKGRSGAVIVQATVQGNVRGSAYRGTGVMVVAGSAGHSRAGNYTPGHAKGRAMSELQNSATVYRFGLARAAAHGALHCQVKAIQSGEAVAFSLVGESTAGFVVRAGRALASSFCTVQLRPSTGRGAAATWHVSARMLAAPGAVRGSAAIGGVYGAAGVRPAVWRAGRMTWHSMGSAEANAGAIRGSASRISVDGELQARPGAVRGSASAWLGNSVSSARAGAIRGSATWANAIGMLGARPGAIRGSAAQGNSTGVLAAHRPGVIRGSAAKLRGLFTGYVRPGAYRGAQAAAKTILRSFIDPLKTAGGIAHTGVLGSLHAKAKAHFIGRSNIVIAAACRAIPVAYRPAQAFQALVSTMRAAALRYRMVVAVAAGESTSITDAIANPDRAAYSARSMRVPSEYRTYVITPEQRTMRIT